MVIPKNFRRDIERGRPRVQLLVDGSDPLSAARVAATSAKWRRPSRRRPVARCRTRRGWSGTARQCWSICGSASGSTRRCSIATSSSRRWRGCCSPTCVCRQPAAVSSPSARAAPTSKCWRCRPRRWRSCSASWCRSSGSATACSASPRIAAGLFFGCVAAGQLAGAGARHLAVRACLARHRGVRVDAGAHLGAGGVHHRVLHHAVVRAVGLDVSRTS